MRTALSELLSEAGDSGQPPVLSLDLPRQKDHGDFASNAAMVLAKRLGQPPRTIAERLIELVGDGGGLLARCEVAGPGFVNFWLADNYWQSLLCEIVRSGKSYGSSRSGAGQKLQVEFVSANPTGPLSTGHGRQAVLGDAICRLLAFTGNEVTREYYFNNGGRQMRVLGESVKARYLESLGQAAPPTREMLEKPDTAWRDSIDGMPVVFPKDGYQGDYVGEIAAAFRSEYGDARAEEPGDGLFREKAQELIFADIRATLAGLGIHFDVYYNERSLYDEGKLDEAIADLRGLDLVYEAEGAVWLRATKFDLDRDRVLVKSSGEPTYLLPDIAYHREKFRRGFDRVVDVQGADHIEQFPFVRSAAAALGCPADRIELVMHQFVTLTSGGQQVKQSTRKATYVTVDELLEQIGADVFRFFMVERKAEGHLDFDLDLARDRNWRKNPAYYVQYAHARTHGIERKAAETKIPMPLGGDFAAARLDLPEELELVKKLSEFPDVVLRAADTREPHHITYYLREVAGLWNPYLQDGQRHRVISDDAELTAARLGLALAVRTVLANGLGLLGISAPESM
ncbi:MAG: arginine--tRNA ligase [Deltaproteobacteria bacterium]|nr:arginine--tRNA ligase [Deltaproteobacteria bacterium]MBW2420689.1 arginine--tRNA ligase [Deltaproteobacteria bacterium]